MNLEWALPHTVVQMFCFSIKKLKIATWGSNHILGQFQLIYLLNWGSGSASAKVHPGRKKTCRWINAYMLHYWCHFCHFLDCYCKQPDGQEQRWEDWLETCHFILSLRSATNCSHWFCWKIKTALLICSTQLSLYVSSLFAESKKEAECSCSDPL